MSPEGLKEALQHALLRKTFRPFLIELTSGTRLTVERPEDLEFLEFTVCLHTPGHPPKRNWFDAHSVARVCDQPERPATVDPMLHLAEVDLFEPQTGDDPLILD
jgi:hypothetical protein